MKKNIILALAFVLTVVTVSCGFQASTYINNGSGADVRAAMNNALKSIMSQHSGPTAPDNLQPFMYWMDTSTTPPTQRQRNAGNTAWTAVPQYVQMNGGILEFGEFDFIVSTAGNFPLSRLFVSSSSAQMLNSTETASSTVWLTNGEIQIVSTMNGKMYFKSELSAPSSASAACQPGEMRFDTNYMYRCVATNTWKRIAMSTW